MNVRLLLGDPDDALAAAIARFEQQFTYPLGEGRRFRIAHGDGCWRFFRAQGEAACAIALHDGEVVGMFGAALRRLAMPDGSSRCALYLGDLKIATTARGGLVLARLAQAIIAWVGGRTAIAFAVVMDGTAITPQAYTGRIGIPRFAPQAAIAILWLHTAGSVAADDVTISPEEGPKRYATLAAGSFRAPDADPVLRSVMAPRWLVTRDGSACGRLEDTLRAKRLFAVGTDGNDDSEMRSAHLSCFACREPAADGQRLLDSALALAASSGFPALFVAVASDQADAWATLLGPRIRTIAPATIWATGLDRGLWSITTADI